ncbi:ABC transporter permease [Paucibacter sp. APW11]|uniref:ABC transporter permease n=1 Tax=Roseateles aquae TaxID=3077235 RepID=A0ABU3PGV9_9BURK|nr:ABC transporter permease [Paucibacter sp. APW11]MDT9001815.1 ABC transporter permease [Paucibacter sp. APW11]
MLGYYFELALRSFRRSPGLTALMLLTLAMGVAACMTTLTVFHVLSADPVPGKSDKLFYVQLDSQPLRGFKPGDEPADQLTRFDAEALLRDAKGVHQAVMTAGNVAITPEGQGKASFFSQGRFTSADFFAMFDTPFQYGSGWSKTEDEAKDRVAVITRSLNDELFGGANSVGKNIRLRGKDFRIVGVLDHWQPVPHFYDLTIGSFGELEKVFIPFSTSQELRFGAMGSMWCWGNVTGDPRGVNAPCGWLQYWVQLDTPAQVSAYHDYLMNYSDRQREAGRFERPSRAVLSDVMSWLRKKQVVPDDISLQLWLAFGFLAVCLTNTVGLLLAKCLRRSGDIGVRRALGASRREIFKQFLVEAGSLGLVGGLLGLGLTLLGLWGVRHGGSQYARLIELDLPMLATTLGLALLASLIAGLLPAWRACQVMPAIQLKTQ